MNTIQESNIKQMFSSLVFKRGEAYYKNNQVSDLLYDINYKIWTATVHGTENYFVEINMSHLDQGSISGSCECPAYDAYGSCKHLVAVLLSIANTSNQEKQSYSYQTTNRFMQALMETNDRDVVIEGLSEKTPMQVEYFLKWTYDDMLLLHIKTGTDRCYVVKDIRRFLNNVINGREHVFTKRFMYRPDAHFFGELDYEILELIYDFLRNERIYEESYSIPSYYEKQHGDRYVVIPPLFAHDLLEKLETRHVTVQANDKDYLGFQLKKGELPFQFSFTKNESDDLHLEMHQMKHTAYLKDYQLLFSEGTFYIPTKKQSQILDQIAKFGIRNHRFPILKTQADVFLSEVMPVLKDVGEVTIDEKVAEDIVHVPLKAKLYLDYKDGLVVGNLKYVYGVSEISPFDQNKSADKLIIRDTTKEQQIMQLIEHADFRYNGKELYMEAFDEEVLYEFLHKLLPMLDEYVELFLTSSMRELFVDTKPIPSTSVRVDSDSNLLEIGFDISGVDENEIDEILQAVVEKKRYYRMSSGAIISLEEEEFASMQQFFQDLDLKHVDLQDGNVKMPVYRSTQVDELIETNKNYDPSFRKLLHQLKSPEEQVYPVPKNLKATLRSYQETGYQWFKSLSHYHLGGILADDMGLGKTVQSIAYMLSESSEHPHLVIAPSSVVYNWKNECNKFAPDLDVVVMSGTPEERKIRILANMNADVWITSYATVRQDIDLYKEQKFHTLILDEAQYIKNYATKTSKAIRQIQAKYRFALSGTPIENAIDELWSIFQVVLPGLMPNQRAFKQLSNEKIASITRPFILRRVKEDVLKELPEKIESVHVSELTEEQKKLYVGYLRELQQEASQSIKTGGFNENRMKILAGLTRLRQLCCHPSLFIENYQGKSGKLEQLLETVKNSIANGKRMLIFSQFTSMHEIMKEKLEAEGIHYFYLHGGTPSEERVQMSERFNNGEKSVFLISLRAGGTGLNLTGADTVILYDLWWNPAVEDQATGRAHRFGQKKVVHVIRFITEGTIEEKIYKLQQKKRELIDQIIQPGEKALSSLSEEDVRELLSI